MVTPEDARGRETARGPPHNRGQPQIRLGIAQGQKEFQSHRVIEHAKRLRQDGKGGKEREERL